MHALRRVSASSGAAAPLGCVIFFVFFEIVACTSRARSFLCAMWEWYHYPRYALRIVETPGVRL